MFHTNICLPTRLNFSFGCFGGEPGPKYKFRNVIVHAILRELIIKTRIINSKYK